MTVLVSLITKDAAVLGCDSLATSTKPLVDPYRLVEEFHIPSDDPASAASLSTATLLSMTIGDLFNEATDFPDNHMTHVDKLYSLEPIKMGIMTTGISALGSRTINSLIAEFKEDHNFGCGNDKNAAMYNSVEQIATNLFQFMEPYYNEAFPAEEEKHKYRPQLQFILSGYSSKDTKADSKRLTFPDMTLEHFEGGYGQGIVAPAYGLMFGGQTKEIERIMFGIDRRNAIHFRDNIIKDALIKSRF